MFTDKCRVMQKTKWGVRWRQWTAALLMAALLEGASEVRAQQRTEDFQRPVDRFAYAQGLKQAKIYDYAEKAFRDFLERHPRHELAAKASANVIDCQRLRRDDAGMLKSIEEFRQRWPKHANVDVFTFWEGEALLRQGNHAGAAACFEKLLKAKDASLAERSTFWLARCLFRGDAASIARGYQLYRLLAARPLEAKAPQREIAVCELAREEHRQRHYQEALKLYGVLADCEHARASLRDEALYRLGEIHFAQGDFQKARAAYDRSLNIFPRGSWANEVRCRRAEAVFQLKQFDDALRLVLEWRSMNPGVEDVDMDFLHGRCLYRLGEYGTAWPHFEAVVKQGEAPNEMRRVALVYGIHCLLEEGRKEAWERGLDWCRRYREGYRDAVYESKVEEFAGRLLENLGRYEEALAAYATTLKLLPETEASRRCTLLLRQAECQRKLSHWREAAALLRQVAGDAAMAEHRVRHLLQAAELEMKADAVSPQAEKDYRVLLAEPNLTAVERAGCHKRLLAIYTERKDHAQAQRAVEALYPLCQGEERAEYLFLDARLLAELKRPNEALARVEEALATPNIREARDVDMRLLALHLLLERHKAGDADTAERAVEHFRQLVTKPVELTSSLLTPVVLYSLGKLTAERYERTRERADRQLQVVAYERALSEGYQHPAACFAAFELAKLMLEPGDGRLAEAETHLRQLTDTLQQLLAKEKEHEEFLRQLGQPENLLRESLALLAKCAFSLGHDSEAMSAAERVISRGANYSAAKSCLLVQARIFYERKPQRLERALEKLAQYQYVLSADRMPPAEEAEAMVLMVKVLLDLKRVDSAVEAYGQLKIRYPERARELEGRMP